jgi:ferredoxin
MKLHVDLELCTGHGRCYALYPDLFDADDRGDAIVLMPDVPPEFQVESRESVACCPEGAISVVESEGS